MKISVTQFKIQFTKYPGKAGVKICSKAGVWWEITIDFGGPAEYAKLL